MAKNIRFLRRKNHWSQEYIADKLGYKSYTTIQKWEAGISEPALHKLKELSELFSVDMNDLVNNDLSKSSEKEINLEVSRMAEKMYMNDLVNNDLSKSSEKEINLEVFCMAEKIYMNKELYQLFNIAIDASPSDIQQVQDMLLFLKQRNKE